MDDGPVVRRRILVEGRVQGVWYRQSCADEARRLGVRGWVRNRSDGRVEAEVEGDRMAVEELQRWMAEGPPRAVVTRVEAAPVPDDDRLPPRFQVR